MPQLPGIGSQFNRFLFAPLFEDGETSLSVLSALARQDIDAWQEAARLDQLPREAAANGLASKIWKANSERWSPSDASIIAAGLIELLPSHGVSHGRLTAAEGTHGKFLMWLAYGIIWGSIAISGSGNLQSSKESQQTNYVDSAAVQQEPVPPPSHGASTDQRRLP